jgi:hypothetical protein
MKSLSIKGYWMLVMLIALASCKKYNSLGFTPGKGAPSINSVHTWSKTDTTTRYDTVYTYDASGNLTTSLKQKPNQITPFDSATNAGSLGTYYVINGNNLGSATSVTFNGMSAYFNRGLMTDNSIVIQVPPNTPYLGSQATDSLIVTTLYGKASYKFSILPPPPTPATYSDYDFWSGSQISLTGVGFAAVSSVGLTGTAATASIVSKTDTTLVLQFPSTTVSRASLVFNYSSLGTPATVLATQELVNLDNALTIFYKNDFQNSWQDNSWSHPSGTSTEATHSFGGTSSIRANYPAGGWQIEGWAGWSGPQGGLPYDPAYKFLTFWVKGGTVDHTLVLVGDKMPGGYGQVQNASAIPIQLIKAPKGVWTYYKIPLGTANNATQLPFWGASPAGVTAQQLGFFLQGQNGDVNEVMYFDEVGFVK